MSFGYMCYRGGYVVQWHFTMCCKRYGWIPKHVVHKFDDLLDEGHIDVRRLPKYPQHARRAVLVMDSRSLRDDQWHQVYNDIAKYN